MPIVTDELGFAFQAAAPARRVVSLVPSLTESIALTRPEALVGATEWCTHPAGLDVPRIRGTKNPDTAAIIALAPDLVLANKEENRRLDVDRLRAAGVAVWVSDIQTVPQALTSLRRMFEDALGWAVPAWLEQTERLWRGTSPDGPRRAAIAIWRDPWMVVGSATFTGDLAARIGLQNVFADHADRYPHVAVSGILAAGPELIVLPDEPYVFTATDGPEAFPDLPSVLVEGRLLTWYGPSLLTAYDTLHELFGER